MRCPFLFRQVKEEESGEKEKSEMVNMTPAAIGVWVGMCCVLLLLLYKFYTYLGTWVYFIYLSYTMTLHTTQVLMHLKRCSDLPVFSQSHNTSSFRSTHRTLSHFRSLGHSHVLKITTCDLMEVEFFSDRVV